MLYVCRYSAIHILKCAGTANYRYCKFIGREISGNIRESVQHTRVNVGCFGSKVYRHCTCVSTT